MLAALTIGVIYSARYRYSVRLNEPGVEAEPAGGRARKDLIINSLLLLSGRPGARRAGLTAHGCRRERARSSEVDDVVGDSRPHSIELRRRGRPLTVVACTSGIYEEVLAKARLLADSCEQAGAG
ncbi:MAG: hypothetical protein HPY83_04845 [Anaerolineae bacterium]|nr:hypothetical protein [Anaerolineae bacterium]